MTDFLVSDLHITANPRDQYRLNFLERLPALARDHDANCVCILGDLTQQKDKHSAWLVNQIVDRMAKLAKSIPTIILAGNHDGEIASEIYFQFLHNIPHIDFITEPTVMGKTLWLPHTRDYKRDWSSLDFKGINRIYAHNTFKGALNENDQELDGISLNVLPNIPIYSGDVHVPQKLGNLTYIGAPYTINFGDKFNPRALLLSYAPNLRICTIAKSIPLDGPQKRVIHVNEDGSASYGKATKGDIVRVQVEMRREDYPRWSTRHEHCYNACIKRGLIVDSIIPIMITDQETREETIQRTAPRNDKQELRAYCKRNSVDDPTIKIGESLL